MNSCLYEGKVMHHRFQPKQYAFDHKVFMFYLDMDELDELNSKLKLFSRNRFNIYSFRDKDHLELSGRNVKENILEYLREKEKVTFKPGKIMLLTNLRTLGHIFNPVSFYFFFDEAGKSAGVLAEVGNTFGELKPYWLGPETLMKGSYTAQKIKNYYISPFMDLDLILDFNLKVPDDRIFLKVDDVDKKGDRFFISTLSGEKKPLTDRALFRTLFFYPLITLKVISLIHWHAIKLWLKKIPHRAKHENPELQQGVFREHKTIKK